jgi:transposase-like protein
LQRALEEEVELFLGRSWYERSADGAVHGYRNGYESKKVHLAEGTIELEVVPEIRTVV